MSCQQEMPPVASVPGFLAYGGEQQHHDSYGIDIMFSGRAAPATGLGVLHHHYQQQQGHHGGYEYPTWESRKQQQKNLPVPHYGDSYHYLFYQALRLKENFLWIAPSSNQIVKGPIVKHQQVKQGMQRFSVAHHYPQQARPINKSTPPPKFKKSHQPKKLTLASSTWRLHWHMFHLRQLATSSSWAWKFGLMLVTQQTVALPPPVQQALMSPTSAGRPSTEYSPAVLTPQKAAPAPSSNFSVYSVSSK